MKKIALLLILSFVLALAILLFQELRMYGKPQYSTRGLAMWVGEMYERYLEDGGEPFEFHTQKEFTSRVEAASTAAYVNFWAPPDFVDKDGQIIDTWGRPFQITRKRGPQIEIRSAANDGKFYTFDDVVEVYPEESQK